MKKVFVLVVGFLILAFLVLYLKLYRKAIANYELYTTQTLIFQRTRLRHNTLSINNIEMVIGSGSSTGLVMNNPNMDACTSTLQPVSVIEINEKISNCTTKKKQGVIPSAQEAVSDHVYTFHDGEVGVSLKKDDLKADILCKENGTGDKADIYYRKLRSQGKEQSLGILPPFILDPMKVVGSKGILSSLNTSTMGDIDYCAEGEYSEVAGAILPDADCVDMKEGRATSGRKYYFVAGYRKDMDNKLLYVINGKVYNPDDSDLSKLGQIAIPVSGRWQFVKVVGNRAIVKRITDAAILPDQKDVKGNQMIDYTLQTCDLAL